MLKIKLNYLVSLFHLKFKSNSLCSVDSEKGTVPNMPLRCLDASCGMAGTLLMELSKAYVFINHDLIIGKLEAYGVRENSLRLIKVIFPKGNKE